MKRYKCSVSVYYKSGSVHSLTLEAPTLEEMKEEKLEFLKDPLNLLELVSFNPVYVVTREKIEPEEAYSFVDTFANEYIGDYLKKLPPKKIENDFENI